MDDRQRRILIRVITITLLVMAVAFVVYVVVGFNNSDPSVECLVEAFLFIGAFVGGLRFKIWAKRELWGVKWGGFMQPYRRKKWDED